MDRVRFGRALGAGAREAARALLKAADAAAAPNPNAPNPNARNPNASSAARPASSPSRPTSSAARPEIQSPGTPQRTAGSQAGRRMAQAKRSAATTTAGVREGGARFGKAVWGPFLKLSGVLWLEVTGVFFGLFALTAAIGIWKSRSEFRAGVAVEHRLWFAVGMLALFGYFSVSSFVRARRRGRG